MLFWHLAIAKLPVMKQRIGFRWARESEWVFLDKGGRNVERIKDGKRKMWGQRKYPREEWNEVHERERIPAALLSILSVSKVLEVCDDQPTAAKIFCTLEFLCPWEWRIFLQQILFHTGKLKHVHSLCWKYQNKKKEREREGGWWLREENLGN